MVDKTASASPADTNTDRNDASSTSATDRNDASSTSTGADQQPVKEEAKSGLDIVRAVLEVDADNQPLKKEDATPSPSNEQVKDTTTETPDAKADDETSKGKATDGKDVLEEAAKSSFRDDPVFKQVTATLRETRTKLDEATAAHEADKPYAKAGRDFAGFLQQTGLKTDAVQELLEIGALVLQDPREARKRVAEVLEDLDTMLGEKISDDLQRKVDDGDLSIEDARRISRAEADAKLAKNRVKQTTVEQKTAEDEKKVEDQRATIARTVNARVATLAKSDTDFEKKAPLLEREVVFLMQKNPGTIKSINDAVKLVDDAYANVNKFFKNQVASAPSDIRPTRNGGAEATTTKTLADLPATATGLDVTRAALGLT